LATVVLRPAEPAAEPLGPGFNPMTAPALAGRPWVGDVAREVSEVVDEGLVYTPYVGYSLADYDGEVVEVQDRQRRSWQPPGAASFEVWFFGGSTMFGFSLQRDEHTIPSEVARLAAASGRPLRVRNFGAPGYVNFQETVLFAQLLGARRPPDLAVFYDGINDKSLQIANAFGGLGYLGEPGDLFAHEFASAIAAQRGNAPGRPSPLDPDGASGPEPTGAELVDAIIDVYSRGVDLARSIGRVHGVPVVHFWQPDVYTKELLPDEEVLLPALGLDAPTYEVMAAVGEAVRRELPAEVVDLSDAYDAAAEPVLTDFVHTNEEGAALVARAMWPHVLNALGPVR